MDRHEVILALELLLRPYLTAEAVPIKVAIEILDRLDEIGILEEGWEQNNA